MNCDHQAAAAVKVSKPCSGPIVVEGGSCSKSDVPVNLVDEHLKVSVPQSSPIFVDHSVSKRAVLNADAGNSSAPVAYEMMSLPLDSPIKIAARNTFNPLRHTPVSNEQIMNHSKESECQGCEHVSLDILELFDVQAEASKDQSLFGCLFEDTVPQKMLCTTESSGVDLIDLLDADGAVTESGTISSSTAFALVDNLTPLTFHEDSFNSDNSVLGIDWPLTQRIKKVSVPTTSPIQVSRHSTFVTSTSEQTCSVSLGPGGDQRQPSTSPLIFVRETQTPPEEEQHFLQMSQSLSQLIIPESQQMESPTTNIPLNQTNNPTPTISSPIVEMKESSSEKAFLDLCTPPEETPVTVCNAEPVAENHHERAVDCAVPEVQLVLSQSQATVQSEPEAVDDIRSVVDEPHPVPQELTVSDPIQVKMLSENILETAQTAPPESESAPEPTPPLKDTRKRQAPVRMTPNTVTNMFKAIHSRKPVQESPPKLPEKSKKSKPRDSKPPMKVAEKGIFRSRKLFNLHVDKVMNSQDSVQSTTSSFGDLTEILPFLPVDKKAKATETVTATAEGSVDGSQSASRRKSVPKKRVCRPQPFLKSALSSPHKKKSRLTNKELTEVETHELPAKTSRCVSKGQTLHDSKETGDSAFFGVELPSESWSFEAGDSKENLAPPRNSTTTSKSPQGRKGGRPPKRKQKANLNQSEQSALTLQLAEWPETLPEKKTPYPATSTESRRFFKNAEKSPVAKKKCSSSKVVKNKTETSKKSKLQKRSAAAVSRKCFEDYSMLLDDERPDQIHIDEDEDSQPRRKSCPEMRLKSANLQEQMNLIKQTVKDVHRRYSAPPIRDVECESSTANNNIPLRRLNMVSNAVEDDNMDREDMSCAHSKSTSINQRSIFLEIDQAGEEIMKDFQEILTNLKQFYRVVDRLKPLLDD